jgi:hypothetical protein
MDAETNKSASANDNQEMNLWFLAELVVVHSCAGWELPLVHVNYVLIEATDKTIAYEKAKACGESYSVVLHNSDLEEVTITFGGVRELYPLGSTLIDCTELFYQEFSEISQAKLAEWVVPMENLRAFSV